MVRAICEQHASCHGVQLFPAFESMAFLFTSNGFLFFADRRLSNFHVVPQSCHFWGWKPQSFSLPHWGGNHTRGLYLRACHGELKIWRFVLSLRDNLTEEELEALPMSPMEENTWLEEPGEDLVTWSITKKQHCVFFFVVFVFLLYPKMCWELWDTVNQRGKRQGYLSFSEAKVLENTWRNPTNAILDVFFEMIFHVNHLQHWKTNFFDISKRQESKHKSKHTWKCVFFSARFAFMCGLFFLCDSHVCSVNSHNWPGDGLAWFQPKTHGQEWAPTLKNHLQGPGGQIRRPPKLLNMAPCQGGVSGVFWWFVTENQDQKLQWTSAAPQTFQVTKGPC